jgi:hypothetical protein
MCEQPKCEVQATLSQFKVLSQTEDTGSTRNLLAFLGLRLRQHCLLVTLAFVKKIILYKELIGTKETVILSETYGFKNCLF